MSILSLLMLQAYHYHVGPRRISHLGEAHGIMKDMSSAASPCIASEVEISGRLAILEHQQQALVKTQTEMLAALRELRDDFRRHSEIMSGEITRVYEAVLEGRSEPKPDPG